MFPRPFQQPETVTATAPYMYFGGCFQIAENLVPHLFSAIYK